MQRLRAFVFAAMLACFTALSAAQTSQPTTEPADDDAQTIAEQLAAIEAVTPSLGQLEITLRYDKGQEPTSGGWGERCPNCGQYHGMDLSALDEERPLEMPAFMISDTMIVTPDPQIHPRFIESIAVRFGKEVIPAEPAGLAIEQNAAIFKLKHAPTTAKPLKFDSSLKGPYLAISYSQGDGTWMTDIAPLGGALTVARDGRKFIAAPGSCIITDEAGAPVAISMREDLPLDDSWKGSPLAWKTLSQQEVEAALKKLETTAGGSLSRITLTFRSPRKTDRYSDTSRYSGDEDENSTVRNVIGGLIDENRMLVMANLRPQVTARLESIDVHLPGGKTVKAKFSGTLKDYGAFIASIEPGDAKLPATLSRNDDETTSHRSRLLLAMDAKLEGDSITCHFMTRRIADFEVGYKGRVFPEMPGSEDNLILFDLTGKLVAMPLARREKVGTRDRYSSNDTMLTPVSHLTPVLKDLAANFDPANVPVSEAQENRLAWLGVELQGLNRELARINKVSDQTRNGEIGALVTYVHPGSPADQAGVQVGDVLVRMQFQGQPAPVDVQINDYDAFGGSFPWQRFDDLPEAYYDRVPRPWPSADNQINRMLTDLGFGKKFSAELCRDGKAYTKDFVVTEGPAHYDSAARFESKPIGLTVRDLTYEVLRYFQRKPEDGGVIISKIEMGSRASVAGLKPYEIITSVNDAPVKSVQDFQKLIDQPGELRLAVKRMTKGRVVILPVKTPTTRPSATSRPATGDIDDLMD